MLFGCALGKNYSEKGGGRQMADQHLSHHKHLNQDGARARNSNTSKNGLAKSFTNIIIEWINSFVSYGS